MSCVCDFAGTRVSEHIISEFLLQLQHLLRFLILYLFIYCLSPPPDCAPLEDRAQGCSGHCRVPSASLHTVDPQNLFTEKMNQ